MQTKILFLDFDGPMIPRRAYFLPNQTYVASVFDPCAVAMINNLIKETNTKLVISSAWATKGKQLVEITLKENGIDPCHLHDDWATPRKLSSHRATEIEWWLKKHPEVSIWAAIDDQYLDLEKSERGIRVSFDDGILLTHYQKLLELLHTPEEPEEHENAN